MGVAIPQIITEDRASGALVVDGSLRFDSSKSQYLTRTPASASNQKTWTWSGWIKGPFNAASYPRILNVEGPSSGYRTVIRFTDTSQLQVYSYDGSDFQWLLTTTQVFRDLSAWYHLLVAFDTTQSTSSNRVKIYVNGVQITTFATASYPSQNFDAAVNHTSPHTIGGGQPLSAYLSNPYLIDGQALDASYFGYTDTLTNTWRPKKLSSSVAFGTNGFYLPFDGSAPIGQDQSGRGNNWTPVNFGGSNTLEKATGALPILNTDGGGKVARVGVRTDSSASSLVLALPLVGIKSDFSNAVNSGTSNKAITATNAVASSAQSNFYGGSFVFDGTGDYLTVASTSDLTFGTGDFTLEYWINTTDTSFNFMHPESATGSGYWGHIIQSSSFKWNDAYATTNLWEVSGAPILDGRWHHCAICRASGVTKVFFDGVSQSTTSGTFTDSTNYSGTTAWEIGGSGNLSDFSGYIQDIRVYKGLAKYTQNFIPASTDPDILPDTPSGVSYTSNLTQITDGAVAFDGSGDYLSLGYNTDIDLSGSGTNFTVEAFIYKTSAEEDQIVEFRGGGSTGWTLYAKTNNTLEIYDSGAGGQSASSGTITLNAWNHIALTKNGSGSNNCTYWINGVSAGTFTLASFTATDSTGLRIGASKDTGAFLTGFLSNFHVVKGTAL